MKLVYLNGIPVDGLNHAVVVQLVKSAKLHRSGALIKRHRLGMSHSE